MEKRKLLFTSLLLSLILCFNASSKKESFVFAETTSEINLGNFDIESSTFKNATSTSNNKYKSIVVSLASDIVGNETIVLPNITGYNLDEDISSEYSKVIKLDSEASAKDIMEKYFSKIGFHKCENQKVSVILSKEYQENIVSYFAGNDHYYMYIPEPEVSWVEQYNDARNMTFMGRKGYLATVTNLEEDLFVFKATGNAIGWLGGTMLKKPTESADGLYYDFSPETVVDEFDNDLGNYEDHWYWACGPERGEEFFDTPYIQSSSQANDIYERNIADYYFNWNTIGAKEPNGGDMVESCLTTLQIGSGYSTDLHVSKYSWNNISYDNTSAGSNTSQGYVVEFGDLKKGNTPVTEDPNYLSATSTFHSHNGWTAWTNSSSLPTTAGNYYLDTDVTLTATWTVPTGTTNLCLDGHIINANNGNFSAITVQNGADLFIDDCKTTNHEFKESDVSGLLEICINDGDYTATGGVITGSNKTGDGGAIDICEGGTLHIISANIIGNKATNGGAINNEGALYYYHGDILGNVATKGGGIYHNSDTNVVIGFAPCLIGNVGGNLHICKDKMVTFDSGANALLLGGSASTAVSVSMDEYGLFATCDEDVPEEELFKYESSIFANDSDNSYCAVKKSTDGLEFYLTGFYNITNNLPGLESETNHGLIVIFDNSDETIKHILFNLRKVIAEYQKYKYKPLKNKLENNK